MIAIHVVTGMDGGAPAYDVYQGDSLIAWSVVPQDGVLSFTAPADSGGILVAGYRPMSVPDPPEEARPPPRARLSWWDRLVVWVRRISWW